MAFEFYTPGQQFQPDWVHAWSPQAFRQLYADTGFDPGMLSASALRDGGDYDIRNRFYDYLGSQGMKLGLDSKGQYGKYQVFDKAGNPVGSGEDFNSGGMELLTPLLIAGGVAGLQALGGLGGAGAAAGASEAGIGTLGAGGSAAGGFTASPLTGLGASGGLTTGAASIPTLAELGYGAGSLGAAAGGAFVASPISGLGATGGLSSGAASLPTLGELGYGAGSLGSTGVATLGSGDTPVTAFKSEPLTGMGANGGLSGTSMGLSKLGGAGFSVLDMLKDPAVKYGLTGLGALAGASDAGKGSEASVQSKMDPRMEQYVYGSGYGDPNSLLGAAQALWKQNPTGINPLMQQGLDLARSALTDPGYTQAYTNMRNLGNGLLSMQVAGNPFTQGRQLPNAGGLLGNGNTGIVPPDLEPPNVGVPTMKALPYMGRGLL